jgi:uncharacterized LabA/DUF88 family protein
MMRSRKGYLDIFIDGGYFNSVQHYFELNFDFLRFVEEIRRVLQDNVGRGLELSHVFFYDCLPRLDYPYPQEDRDRYFKKYSFFNYLRTLRWVRVREGYLSISGQEQKEVDTLIGLDMVNESGKGLVDYMALVSGDGDLAPAVETAGEHSVQVWLFYNQSCSQQLWNTADGRCEIDVGFAERVRKST